MTTPFARGSIAAAMLLSIFATSSAASAQQVFHACYVPEVGAVYMIGIEGLPQSCLSENHVAVSWTDGEGVLAEGAVTSTELADGAVITAKLADGAVISSKLADGAVTGARLADDAVAAQHVAFAYAASATEGGAALDADRLDGLDATDLLPGGTLPSNATLRGVYAVGWHSGAAGDLDQTQIAFGFSLGSAPTAHFIPKDGTPPPACPGTPVDPQAAPGNLCVYEGQAANIASRLICNLTATGGSSCPRALPWGAHLLFTSTGAAFAYSRGTWAVTAP